MVVVIVALHLVSAALPSATALAVAVAAAVTVAMTWWSPVLAQGGRMPGLVLVVLEVWTCRSLVVFEVQK